MTETTHDGTMDRRPDDREATSWTVVLLVSMVALIAIGIAMHYSKDGPDIWVNILGVIATMGIFSILYKENPAFRFMEHIFVGLATGYGIVVTWLETLKPLWYTPMMPPSLLKDGGGQWWMIFGLLLSLMFYSVYFPKLSWMNRLIIGVVMGWGAGIAFQAFVGLVAPQLTTSFKAPITAYGPAQPPTGLGRISDIHIANTSLWLHPYAIIFLVVLLCTMAYFFFSIEHRSKWVSRPAIAGRYFIMIALGAIFGTTVMGRITLLIGRLDFIKTTFTGWGAMVAAWWAHGHK